MKHGRVAAFALSYCQRFVVIEYIVHSVLQYNANVGRHVILSVSKPACVNFYKISKNINGSFLELEAGQPVF